MVGNEQDKKLEVTKRHHSLLQEGIRPPHFLFPALRVLFIQSKYRSRINIVAKVLF